MRSLDDSLNLLSLSKGFTSADNMVVSMYVYSEMHESVMAKELGVSRSVIRRLLVRNNISIRGLKEAKSIYEKNPTIKQIEQRKRWVLSGIEHNRTNEDRERRSKRMMVSNPAKTPEARAKISASKQGSNNAMFGLRGKDSPNYKGGYCHHDYRAGTIKFTEELRARIRARDNYKCQECGEDGKDVHHIDYNKSNNSDENLITLCHRCHMKTNSPKDRNKYTERYSKHNAGI